MSINQFNVDCKKIRKNTLECVFKAGSGHIGPSFSIIELTHFIHKYERDFNFILSKGHAAPGLYACLYQNQLLSKKEFFNLRKIGSKTQGHPDRLLFKKIDCSTGALGQGLSVAIGYAIGDKHLNKSKKTFCILGDGEMQEGQIWESLLFLGNNYLRNLITIIDYNKYQNEMSVKDTFDLGNLKKKLSSFNLEVIEINGHDYKDIKKAFKIKKLNKNLVVIAHTIKGKGISFMENDNHWHSAKLNKDNYLKAIEELNI